MIEKLSIRDINEVVSLEKEYLKESLEYDLIYNEITNNSDNSYIKIYKVNNKIVGYLSARITDNKAEVLNLIVINEYQKQGIASKLLKDLIINLEKGYSIILEVRQSNRKAIAFYEKQGFKKFRVIPNYYKSEDAVLYLKED